MKFFVKFFFTAGRINVCRKRRMLIQQSFYTGLLSGGEKNESGALGSCSWQAIDWVVASLPWERTWHDCNAIYEQCFWIKSPSTFSLPVKTTDHISVKRCLNGTNLKARRELWQRQLDCDDVRAHAKKISTALLIFMTCLLVVPLFYKLWFFIPVLRGHI